ncbi:hypothetical protein KSP39_PZI013588 [Platanthera zijinensis]|uniref:Uncharacterized protein n=1 Tax=Platanthera zijinensis TaxID=2320716 RepID=A0AAP0BDU3_9ASPA
MTATTRWEAFRSTRSFPLDRIFLLPRRGCLDRTKTSSQAHVRISDRSDDKPKVLAGLLSQAVMAFRVARIRMLNHVTVQENQNKIRIRKKFQI